jgi:hypothetical protein
MARFLSRLATIDAAQLDGTPLSVWLDGAFATQGTRELAAALLRLSTYCADADRLSAGAAIRQLQQSASHGVRYLDGGWATLVDEIACLAVRAGHRSTAVPVGALRLGEVGPGGWRGDSRREISSQRRAWRRGRSRAGAAARSCPAALAGSDRPPAFPAGNGRRPCAAARSPGRTRGAAGRARARRRRPCARRRLGRSRRNARRCCVGERRGGRARDRRRWAAAGGAMPSHPVARELREHEPFLRGLCYRRAGQRARCCGASWTRAARSAGGVAPARRAEGRDFISRALP